MTGKHKASHQCLHEKKGGYAFNKDSVKALRRINLLQMGFRDHEG